MKEYKISGYEIKIMAVSRWHAWHFALTKLKIIDPLIVR